MQVISPSIYLSHFSYHNYLLQKKKEDKYKWKFPTCSYLSVCYWGLRKNSQKSRRRLLRQLGVREVDSQYYIVRFLERLHMYYLLTHWSSDIISNLEPNFSKERAPMGEKHFLNITKQFFKTVRKKKIHPWFFSWTKWICFIVDGYSIHITFYFEVETFEVPSYVTVRHKKEGQFFSRGNCEFLKRLSEHLIWSNTTNFAYTHMISIYMLIIFDDPKKCPL